MKINISPSKYNTYQKLGVLIRGNNPTQWLKSLQFLNVNLQTTNVYPIASKKANELYGCFFVQDSSNINVKALNTILFQAVHNHIFIPEFSKISPKINYQECHSFFEYPQVFHPEFNWVELKEPIIWETLLQINDPRELEITRPSKTISQPNTIKSYQLIAEEEFDIIKALDLKPPKLEKNTLNKFEKVKFNFFKLLYSSKKNDNGGFNVEKRGFLKWLDGLSGSSKTPKESKWEKNLEKLLFKNQKEIDKLLDLFKSNPNLASKLAIPVDLFGVSRSSGNGIFKLFRPQENENGDNETSKFSNFIIQVLSYFLVASVIYLIVKLLKGIVQGDFWPFLSTLFYLIGIVVAIFLFMIFFELFMNSMDTSGRDVDLDSERMNALRIQYEKLAEDAIEQKNYKKAASVYIKLLKDYYTAANTLEEGELYQEAAIIHLKFNKDKYAAAEAFKKGKFYSKAIALHKELENHEEVGDLYKLVNNKAEADKYFQIIIDKYVESHQYVKASLVYKYKIEEPLKAQTLLLKGWRENKDAYNCLNNYFGNFPNSKLLKQGITFIYNKETNSNNIKTFLRCLKIEYKNNEDLQEYIQSIAYEIVANNLKDNPGITFELNAFNNVNTIINKDASKFVKGVKKGRRD